MVSTDLKIPRIVVAGTSGGSGKTLLTLGLIRAFTRRGLRVAPFKKGPDYIDAAWLALAAQRPCGNLDPFFCDAKLLHSLFAEGVRDADIAVIEGNRGLYDGRDAQGTCSTATLARLFDSPIVLSLNCTKMTRTAAAVVSGIASFEPIRLAGVVLSQTGAKRHADVAREAIESYAHVRVFGSLPRLRPNPIPERHMGLVGVDSDAMSALERIADLVEENLDLDSILRSAKEAPNIHGVQPLWGQPSEADSYVHSSEDSPVIGYVRDDALWFYYPENLEALRRAGARLVRLSLLDDETWCRLDGLYLGGGFPELYSEQLSHSQKVSSLKRLAGEGLPIYAECGGFMTLCSAININGKRWKMAGVFPVETDFLPTPQGLGYVEASVVRENPFHPLGTSFRGHEFHYSRCRMLDEGQSVPTCLSLGTGMGMGRKNGQGTDGFIFRNTFASYTHIFAPSVSHWAESFVQACRKFRRD